jgi:hypothetical protein
LVIGFAMALAGEFPAGGTALGSAQDDGIAAGERRSHGASRE